MSHDEYGATDWRLSWNLLHILYITVAENMLATTYNPTINIIHSNYQNAIHVSWWNLKQYLCKNRYFMAKFSNLNLTENTMDRTYNTRMQQYQCLMKLHVRIKQRNIRQHSVKFVK
jgi:hypothetical protein